MYYFQRFDYGWMQRRIATCFRDVYIYIIAVSKHFTHQIKTFSGTEFNIS